MGIFSTFFAAMNAPIPLYTSVCSVKFEKDTTVEGVYAKTMSWSEGDDIETQLSVLKSYPVLKRAASELGLIPDSDPEDEESQLSPEVAQIVDGLRSQITVMREGFANIIAIEVTGNDPVFAQKLANTVALAYREVHNREQNKRTVEAMKYISSELKSVRRKLREAEDAFNTFTQKHQLVSIDLQGENLLLGAKKTKENLETLAESKDQLINLVAKVDQFLKNPSGSGDNLYSDNVNSQYKNSNNRFLELLLHQDTLLKDYTTKHPEVIAIKRKIVETAHKMRIIAQLEIKNIDKKQSVLEARIEEGNRKTHNLMEKKLEYNRLKRKVESLNDMMVLLEKKNQEALIRSAEEPDEVTIVRPAFLPRTPINPPKTATKGMMGVVIGLVIGLVVAFVVETFDTSLGAIDDVEEALGSQVLGIIPHGDFVSIHDRQENGQKQGDTSHFQQEGFLVSHFLPQTMMAESFRALRTNISFADMEKKIKVIAVTATSPSEGKTLVSTNLAITMAQAGMKTLLVECDLRKPMVYKAFGVDRNPGLTDVLLGNYSVDEVTKTITDIMVGEMTMDEVMVTAGLDNLYLLTCGTIPPNPSELIDSQRLVELIDETRREYDIVLFDSPPILSTSDPIILSTKVDAVLLVYRVGSVSRTLLKRSATQLEQVKANLLGVALNDMKSELSPDFGGYKYYKSYYSYKESKEEKKGWKKVLSIFDEMRKKTPFNFSKTRENVTSKKIAPSVSPKQKKRDMGKNRGSLKLWVSLIAVGALIVGVLLQNGTPLVDRDLFAKQPVMKETRPVLPRGKVFQPIKMPISTPPPPKEIPKTKELPAATKPIRYPFKAAISTPPPPIEIPKTKALPATTKPIRYPYSLQVGSFRTLGKAKKEIDLLKKNGLQAYWNHVDLGQKGKRYRIFVESFATSEQAEEAKKKYSLSSATISKTPYAVEIGEFPSKEALNEKMATLSKTVYSPYVIETPNKEYRLLIGSFVSQEGADQVANDLNTLGLNCKAVQR